MPIAPGTKLGQYEVKDFLGQGAMGLVYRAYHAQLERTCAVKVLQAISPDADTVARFRHEAQAIAQLRHPNIVNVYDFGEYQGTPYMIVEYVPGGSLAGRMSQGMLDQAGVLKYLRGIAAGLDYAHRHGIVHRDVKPANVLLTAEDVPVLADFGLAKLLQGSSLKSMTGVTTGTPAYMAPEQVTGAKVGPAADRYSLATIAYEMLTGVIPFDGLALMELLYAQVHRDPETPSSRRPSLAPQLDGVIMRGLAKDPAARWDSSSAFVDSLAEALEARTSTAVAATMVMSPPAVASTVPLAAAAVAAAAPAPQKGASPATVAMAYPAPAAAPPGVTASRAPTERRRPRRLVVGLIAAGAILALLLLAFTVLLLLRPQPTIELNPTTAVPGEDVVVTASHVPANQAGVIELHSTLRTYAFRADSSGNVATDITVPVNVGFGDHVVEICWNGTCHVHATLHVVSRVALASPTPVANQTPSSSAPATATPRSSPTASPTSNPCPASTHSAVVSESPAPAVAGTQLTFAGSYFTPDQSATVYFVVKNALNQTIDSRSWLRTVSCAGGLAVLFTPPLTDIGTATVTARDGAGRSASTTFSIT